MKYLNFSGEATRSEYWGVSVVSFVVFGVAILVSTLLFASTEFTGILIGGILLMAVCVLYIWAFLAVTVKRCRAAGINAWWTASCFVPYIGWVPWIVIGCLPAGAKE